MMRPFRIRKVDFTLCFLAYLNLVDVSLSRAKVLRCFVGGC
jgi:hypothetical protein